MLHTKFRPKSARRRFLKDFYHICDPDAANILSIPLPKEVPLGEELYKHFFAFVPILLL